ncbi:MAG: Rep [Cressdnaviricota sp.]|nr:MAG: Rep [Cressdnaviricota sp.]
MSKSYDTKHYLTDSDEDQYGALGWEEGDDCSTNPDAGPDWDCTTEEDDESNGDESSDDTASTDSEANEILNDSQKPISLARKTVTKRPELKRQRALSGDALLEAVGVSKLAVKRPRTETKKSPKSDKQITNPNRATNVTQKRLKNFHWVLNNPTKEEIRRMKDYGESCKYHTFGYEIGDKQKTPHLQGLTMLEKQISRSVLTKLPHPFGRCFYMEALIGTPYDNMKYCQKDLKFEEYGIKPELAKRHGGTKATQGKRSDIEDVCILVKEGKTDVEIFEEHPKTTFKFLRHIQNVRSLVKPTRTKPLEVHIYYGKPGLGKTHTAYANHPDLFQLPVGKDFWMDRYQRDEKVLFDDFCGKVALVNLLQILDKYIIQVPIKGGFCWWCPNLIILTTNVHPCNWYDYEQRADSYDALKRRISKVLVFKPVDQIDGEAKLYSPGEETDVNNFFEFQKTEARVWEKKTHV